MNKTAVEWLEEQMKTWGDKPRWMRDEIIEQAKAMEKVQIEHAFDIGDLTGRVVCMKSIDPDHDLVKKIPVISSEEFYAKNYGG